jgi:sugar O-acyltransferase (sialic acid O-acetyltransferase NeuD family)
MKPELKRKRATRRKDERRRLFIVGCGGLGRELESLLSTLPHQRRPWNLSGYIDDNSEALNGYPSGLSIVGSVDGYEFKLGDLALLAISDPAAKQTVLTKLRGRVEFLSFIAPDALIGQAVSIGEGVIIGPRCIVGPNVRIGSFVVLCDCSCLGHDVAINDFASVMPNASIAGKCEVGARAFIGLSATVVPGRKIGAEAVVGVGSIVISHVAPRTTVLGNPAKVLFSKGASLHLGEG